MFKVQSLLITEADAILCDYCTI